MAAVMVYIIAAVINWAYRSWERLGYSLVLFVLFMMAGMLASAVLYFTYPVLTSIEIAAAINSATMTLGLVAILYSFITYKGKVKVDPPATGKSNLSIQLFRGSVIMLALLNEVLMGWAFSLISGISKHAFLTTSSLITLLDLAVNSYWFTFTMGSEMMLTLYYFRKRLPGEMKFMLLFQALIMLLAPPALAIWGISTAAVYAGSVAMIVLFIFIFDFFYKNRAPTVASSDYVIRLMGIYALMMASLLYWNLGRSAFFFGITLLVEMVIFFDAVMRSGERRSTAKRQWQNHPWWTFSLLALLFICEYFMAAAIDVVYYGVSFFGDIAVNTLSGKPLVIFIGALFDFVQYFGAVTSSSWFYIMMGAEMGTLVAFQIRKVRELETKVRLALVIAAYGIYSVFLPFFFFPSSRLPHLPFIGWSMGVGTSGPLAPALLVAIGATYLISGSLAYLFGGRQVCSLFCTASLMYQGTFYDSTKSFNRSGFLARKTHGNRLGKVFVITASLVWSSVFAAVLISYLDSIHLIDLYVFGVDPIMFAYTFYFSFLWYVIFVTIPFVGNYGCVTTGICHWGMFNQFIGWLGIFRLRVKDRYECVNCKSKACATVCPVGLTSMPGQFIAAGEFKNYKCIGVGQCVSACPVENIFFYDARQWFRERMGKSKPQTQPGTLFVAPRGGNKE